MHVLTLANCFYAAGDVSSRSSSQISRCFTIRNLFYSGFRHRYQNETEVFHRGSQNCQVERLPAVLRPAFQGGWIQNRFEGSSVSGEIKQTLENVKLDQSKNSEQNAHDRPMGDLDVDWIEFHPLFDGVEFDLAIIGLKSTVQRSINCLWSLRYHMKMMRALSQFRSTQLFPICLPEFKGRHLYRPTKWENYQFLFSLKVDYWTWNICQLIFQRTSSMNRPCPGTRDSRPLERTSMDRENLWY